eukprot:UN00049
MGWKKNKNIFLFVFPFFCVVLSKEFVKTKMYYAANMRYFDMI